VLSIETQFQKYKKRYKTNKTCYCLETESVITRHALNDIGITWKNTQEIATVSRNNRIIGYVSEYQSKGQFYIPASIILRQHTLKYLPQAVPKSTLSDTVLNSHDEEKDPQSKRRILMKITKHDKTWWHELFWIQEIPFAGVTKVEQTNYDWATILSEKGLEEHTINERRRLIPTLIVMALFSRLTYQFQIHILHDFQMSYDIRISSKVSIRVLHYASDSLT